MQRFSNRRDIISFESRQTRTHNNLSELLKPPSLEPDLSKKGAIDLTHSPDMTLCDLFLTCNWFCAENLRRLPAASGGPAAGGNRDVRTAGPCPEVHHLGQDPPLQRPGALQQGSGMSHCNIYTHSDKHKHKENFFL